MFIFGPVLPFRIAALICLLAGLEELSITLVLDKPGANVKSLWHVLRH
jgi:CDP-diacylglycerol--glycerol-3-phosphate 3-phosphatidyltransferase